MMFSYFKGKLYSFSAVFLLIVGLPTLAFAGAKIKIDDTKYFQIGMGFRGSVSLNENNATDPGEDSFDPGLDDLRLYTVSQIHKNIQVEYNTQTGTGNVNLLDAVAKIDFGAFDFWVGRQLPPSDRANLDGPYYLNAAWSFPIVQSFGNLGISAGRDDGVAIHGDVQGGKFKWAYGVFEGVTGGADLDDNVKHTARIDFALGDPEPGFYTGSTYFGAKKLTTLGLIFQHERNSVGSAANQGNFNGFGADLLIERTLGNGAVVDIEGAVYNWDTDDKADGTILQGNSFLVLASYLMPNKTSIGGIQGQFQPYFRYQGYDRDNTNSSGSRGYKDRTEAGLNYVIDGFNAKITALWYLDSDEDSGSVDKNTGMLAMQFQL